MIKWNIQAYQDKPGRCLDRNDMNRSFAAGCMYEGRDYQEMNNG